jgi:hypothetical protein
MNMEFDNKLRDLLNQDSEIPESVQLKTQLAFEQIRELANNVKKDNYTGMFKYMSQLKKISAAVLLIAFITGLVGITNPAFAKDVLLKSIFKLFSSNNYGEQAGNFEKLSQGVVKSVTANGLTITLNEVALDENMVAISFLIQGEHINKEPALMGHIDINGKPVTTMSMKYLKVQEDSVAGMVFGNVDQDIHDQVNIEWNVVWLDNVKGPWDFRFNVSKNKTSQLTTVIKPITEVDIGTSTLKVDKIVIGPLDNTIDLSGKYHTSYATNGPLPYSDFELIDDTGKVLISVFKGATSNKQGFSMKLSFMGDMTNVKSITIIPIANKEIFVPGNSKKGFKMVFSSDFLDLNSFKGTSPIKVNDKTSLTVSKIEADEENTKIYFTIDGYYTYYMLNSINFIDDSGRVIETPEGTPFPVISNSQKNEVMVKLPPIDKNNKYKIGVPKMHDLTLDDKDTITIPITK